MWRWGVRQAMPVLPIPAPGPSAAQCTAHARPALQACRTCSRLSTARRATSSLEAGWLAAMNETSRPATASAQGAGRCIQN